MTSNDPLEKSLFSRIKDCVLTELRRSGKEVERASCPSRNLWIWEVPKSEDSNKESKREKRKVKSEDFSKEKKTGDNKSEEITKKKELKESHESSKSQQSTANFAKKEEKIHSGDRTSERAKKSSDLGDEKLESGQHKSDDKSSCKSNKCKPTRYYLKKQNPEAPVCCESLKACHPTKQIPVVHRGNSEFFETKPSCQCG